MGAANRTTVTEFILLGLSDLPELQIPLFILFLVLYLVGLVGNSAIIVAITADPQLHTPMYFFIGNLSLVDICILTVIVPKLLINIISQRKTISFTNCISQLFFILFFASIEIFLLAVMAYDRYVAICNPLHYFLVMSKRVCVLLVVSCWVGSLLHSMLQTMITSLLSFCSKNQVQQFFCDIPPLLKLSCSDTTTSELLIFFEATPVVLASVLSIVVSYVYIISTILKIRSSEGRHKTFSTCSSHLIIVTLYYGTIFFTYTRPTSSYSLQNDKVVTVMYTVITPMLNPFIYSLRNKQVKGALRKTIGRPLSE